MNKAEYAKYEAAVADFFKREGITNLTGGHITCPDCGVEWDDADTCPECGASRESADSPFFSWRPCECCGRHEGGDREHATGWNPTENRVQEYTICEDCIYYAEYGRLDDTTMMQVENNQ